MMEMQETDHKTYIEVLQHKPKLKIVNQMTTLGNEWDLARVIFIAVT